jgi:outer membrane protein assembly factor BamB
MKKNPLLICTLLILLFSCKKNHEVRNDIDSEYVKLLWSNKQFEWIPTTLSVKNKMLYFGNTNRDFYGVNLENSKINFKFKSDYNPFHKPLISGQNLFLTEYGSDLICVDTLGKLKWRIDGETNLRNDLTENDNYLYGSVKNKGFGKLNKTNGNVIWSLPQNSIITETSKPTFFKDKVYLGLSQRYAWLQAINKETGSIIWENKYENFSNINQIETQTGLLVCLDKDLKKGKILLLDYENGKEIWSQDLNCDTYYSPCIINQNIILNTHNNEVVCIDLKTGKKSWVLNLKNDQAASEIVNFKENIFFGTRNRNLYSVTIKTGKTNFIQPFYYGLSTPIVSDNKIYFPTGGSEMWVLK